jgi:hypothetical protein
MKKERGREGLRLTGNKPPDRLESAAGAPKEAWAAIA